ncbi:MAG: sugar ABC transporter ATP-binding protein, partial [Pseudomonas putida]
GGTVIKDGPPEEVMDYYNAIIAQKENATVEVQTLADGTVQTRSGSGKASIDSVALYNAEGAQVEYVSVGEGVCLNINVKVNAPLPELVVGYVIKDRLGQDVFGTNTHHLQCARKNLDEGTLLSYQFRFPANLGVGSYSVAVALHATDVHVVDNYEWRDLALVFNVVNVSESTFVGLAWIPPTVECK